MSVLALVRHPHTEYNVRGERGRFCGISDPPLTERGIEEAKAIAYYLSSFSELFEQIVTSPLIRCRDAAKIISHRIPLPIIIDDRLKEINYGVWEGLTKSEVRKKFSQEWKKFLKNPIKYFPPQGEHPLDALKRIKEAMRDISVKSSIIVGHKTIFRLFLADILKIPLKDYRNFCDLKPASITIVTFRNGKYKVLNLNYTGHLCEE